MLKKNQEYVVTIIDNGYQGEGIAKIDNFAVFIPNAIKGEVVKILILKVTTSHAYGKILEIIEKSKERADIDCNIYNQCGGCNLRHMNYEKTLELKKDIVVNNFKKNAGVMPKINDVIGMENPLHYRNKLKYPVGYDSKGNMVMGTYAERSHRIIPTLDCRLQNEEINKVACAVFQFLKDNNITPYNEDTGRGIVRHIIVKIGIKTNQIMVILVINGDKLPLQKKLVQYIISKHKNVKTIVKNINTKKTNVILGSKNEILFGDGYISDKLGEYEFKISAMSFYQVNPVQTEILYNTAIKYGVGAFSERPSKCNSPLQNIVAFDLYCGVGTISIFLAKHVQKVYGIEVVVDAVKDAKRNAKLNNIDNIEFISGEVEKILPNLVGAGFHTRPTETANTIIFVDPPREGLDSITIKTILKVKPKKIIYISCNPATLTRDVKELGENYDVYEVQPVDMFPYTHHVETVSLLTLKTVLKK